MATSVTDIISAALVDIGVLDPGETADADQASTALDTLNQMLALWQVQNVFVYAQQVTPFSPDGALSYTVGSGADVDMSRPAKIDKIYWRSGDLDYPITMLDTFEQYESIAQKTQAGEPLYAFYLPSYTTGTLYLHPQPSSGTVYLVTQVTLPQPASIAVDLDLPPEYILPVRANLAVLLTSAYGAPLRPATAAMAANGLKVLMRNNLRIQPLNVSPDIPSGVRSNIISGE